MISPGSSPAYGALSLVSHLDWVRIAVAAVALVAGLINVKDYVWFRAGPSLSTPESGKSALIRRMRGVAFADRAPLVVVIATVGLAAGVAVLELPCTAGFPVLWANLVSAAEAGSQATAGLLGLYLGFYLLDELIIVIAVVMTMRVTKLQEWHGRVLKLVSGALMIALAVVLVLAPDAMRSPTALILVPLITVLIMVITGAFPVGNDGRSPERPGEATTRMHCCQRTCADVTRHHAEGKPVGRFVRWRFLISPSAPRCAAFRRNA